MRDILFCVAERLQWWALFPVLLHLKVNGILARKRGRGGERSETGEKREVSKEDERNLALFTARRILAFLRIPLNKWSVNYERPRHSVFLYFLSFSVYFFFFLNARNQNDYIVHFACFQI